MPVFIYYTVIVVQFMRNNVLEGINMI